MHMYGSGRAKGAREDPTLGYLLSLFKYKKICFTSLLKILAQVSLQLAAGSGGSFDNAIHWLF